jgi:hypothetical protein
VKVGHFCKPYTGQAVGSGLHLMVLIDEAEERDRSIDLSIDRCSFFRSTNQHHYALCKDGTVETNK